LNAPSLHAVDVPLLPERANAPVVGYAESASCQLPRHLRESFSDYIDRIAQDHPAVIETADGNTYHGKKHPNVFKTLTFQPGFKPHQALKMARKWKAWFFQSLIPAADKRIQRAVRKERGVNKRWKKRNTRYGGRRIAHIERRLALRFN